MNISEMIGKFNGFIYEGKWKNTQEILIVILI